MAQLHGLPLFVFLAVAVTTVLFLALYLVKGAYVGFQLWSVVRQLRGIQAKGQKVDPAQIGQAFKREPLKHLWDEYSHTLHRVRRASNGDVSISEVRATMPAEAFFTKDVLVDSRLFDDFVRHLPGILTGLGIIGTFAGLLNGLGNFDPSSTEKAVAGLKPLLDGVAHAFIASAVAIGSAMAITFIEKLVLALFYGRVDEINRRIDGFFETGAGEEYLARLTNSAEQSEAHSAQLKEALVADLKQMMTNLVERQIEAQQQSTQALGARIGEAITESLQKPMQEIGAAVQRASGEQGTAVQGMLESVLTAFMAKIEDTFGGQMRGINESIERSMGAMANVQSSLQTLLQSIEKSTENATTQLSGALTEAMQQSAANQQAMTEQLREFVQEFRKLVADEQAKSKQAMDEAVSAVLARMGEAMDNLRRERDAAANQESSRQEQLKERTTELVGGLSGQVEALLKSVAEQVEKTQQNIDSISAVSTRAIEGMNSGANTMATAAQRFEAAGGAVGGVLEKSKVVTEQLQNAATSLQSASTAVRQGFELYDATRKTVDSHVATLTSLIENAKREAGLTKGLLADMERIVEQLRVAENQSHQYLERVNGALVKAFTDFGTQMSNQVSNTIKQTDTHLGNGVSQLNGVVQELAVALARMRRAN